MAGRAKLGHTSYTAQKPKMKLSEAFQIVNLARSSEMPLFRVDLCCGFTPLHLSTFLQAHLLTQLKDRRVEITPGLYGDLAGNVKRAYAGPNQDAAIVVFEWQDVEPRLGYRQLGGWRPSQAAAIVEGCRNRLSQLGQAVRELKTKTPVAMALPGLPLPPVFTTNNAKWSPYAVQLNTALLAFAEEMSTAGVAIVHPQTLDVLSPPGARHDLKSDLFTGFPYTNHHAEILAQLLANCIGNRNPSKKGIITDLDDTMWRGIVGEIGPQSVSSELGVTQPASWPLSADARFPCRAGRAARRGE